MALFRVLTFLSLLTPLLFFVAVFGTRLGLWSLSFGFEVLTFQIGKALAWVGGAVALLALVMGLRRLGQVWPWVVSSLIGAVATLVLYQIQGAAYAVPGGPDVATSVADAPVFSRAIMAERRGRLGQAEACEGLVSVPRQVAPETASAAMKQAGFTPRGGAAFRADGYRESFWFGQTHDVAIRIRPGQTDVRVSARHPVKDGDQSCQLAKAVVAGLMP